MTQLLLYPFLLLTGAVLAGLIFRMRLQKISSSLNQKLDSLIASGSNRSSRTPDNGLSFAGMDPFTAIEKKLEKIALPETKVVAAPAENHELREKSESLKKRFDNLQVVNELGQLVTSSLKLEDTFNHLYQTINSIMDAAVFELGVYSWKDNHWKILSNSEIKNPDAYRNLLAEWGLKNNKEVILADAQHDFERYVFAPPVLSDGRKPESVICFPVYRQESELGTISVFSFNKNAFTEYHIEMIRSLIPYTAVAISNSLIHQELIATQVQLVHNEKMASLGQIASGIAHEILNPLNFVNNFSQISKELIPELDQTGSKEEQTELKGQLVSNLDKIYFHGQRAYTIVKNMMMLSRNGSGEKVQVNVNRSLDDFLEIAYSGFKEKMPGYECRIEKNYDPNLPPIQIVAEDFGSVVLNMLNNAFYTMKEKRKKVSVLAGDSPVLNYEPLLTLQTSQNNGYVTISVRDNGLGIPEEILGKIFLPFFTTKPTGEGTGLGLSISHDIVTKGNKGEMTVKSEMGKGSEFKVSIPLKALA